MELVAKYWGVIWSVLVTAGLIVMALLSKTYARQETVAKLDADIKILKSQLDAMPTGDELHLLNIDIANLSGDIKAIKPQLDSVQKLAELLLENELTRTKRK